ncbi:O-methyltransferase [Salipaludibacillus agaradhaerens]|uniref:O-methyltransferase n=1 Tax=Salipaludibacillus agaradhaerens TaxID=76935 RepID=UPI0021508703|nr:O-methyltransferase [Salipaludibacillus agaradhaerens]MCR6106226.1 O-methyltransferase [Salipaludibacillus agaradhaerens]MCR6118259.1 O-methyltransferase [Salipaludibacillus agaradhaerens]UJW57370.1 O-methyltransferase [Bacillus sp. A116_S68]
MKKNDKVVDYHTSLIRKRADDIMALEQIAQKDNIPIMEIDGIETMLQFLRIHQSQRILEIGTAIGYSGIRMLQTLSKAELYTIERDEMRVADAIENANKCGVGSRFHIIPGDALNVYETVQTYAPFDVLFIDAAKGQYSSFFSLYEPMLKKDGLIFSDNVLFKGMVAGEVETTTRAVTSMVKKIRSFNKKLMDHPRFTSVLLPVGDGLMVTIKNEEMKREDCEQYEDT